MIDNAQAVCDIAAYMKQSNTIEFLYEAPGDNGREQGAYRTVVWKGEAMNQQPFMDAEIEKMTVSELARYIFREVKRVSDADKRDQVWGSVFHLDDGVFWFHEENLLNQLKLDNAVSMKFYDAMAMLKRRGLFMSCSKSAEIGLTSVGERTAAGDDLFLALVDDARELVDLLKDDIPGGLDEVVEQYYLESLRACQEGLYISSAICLGAASERAIDCLKEAVVNCDSKHKALEKKWTSDSVKYILTNIKEIVDPIAEVQLRNDLKEQLELTERLYRINRNDVGHPRKVARSIGRCEQENCLWMFRRYAVTIFTAIAELERAV